MDRSLPGSSVHGILQARILEWVTIPFFRGSSWIRDQTRVSCIAGRFFTFWAIQLLVRASLSYEIKCYLGFRIQIKHWTVNVEENDHGDSVSSVQSLSHVWLFATPWIAVCQGSLSITNSRSPPKPMSIVSMIPSNHLLCCPLLLLPWIFPSIRDFSN